jgi:hypothetical protein
VRDSVKVYYFNFTRFQDFGNCAFSTCYPSCKPNSLKLISNVDTDYHPDIYSQMDQEISSEAENQGKEVEHVKDHDQVLRGYP